MENFGDNLPLAIYLHHPEIIRIVCFRGFHLNLSLDNRGRWGDREYVQMSLDLKALCALIQKIKHIEDGPALELPIDIAIDASIRVKSLFSTLGAALLHGVHITAGRCDHGVIFRAGDLFRHDCYQ